MRREVASRFWAKVNKEGPLIRAELGRCWLWTGAKQTRGYGHFCGRHWTSPMFAHRYSWWLQNGEIPDGYQVLHRCDTRLCVRPAHLFLGTHQDNMDDKVAKGRQSHYSLAGERNGRAKLTAERVREIRTRCAAGEKQVHLAKEYGISRAAIYYALNEGWHEAHEADLVRDPG